MGLASLLLLLPALAAASPLNQDAIDRNTVPVPKAGSTLLARGCSHNNCLRDVIASAFPTRPASADCASYLKTTVTPATTTITSTLTQTSAVITALPVTASTTVPVTETATDEETTTTTAPTTTVTVIAPRQATPTSEIPAYASHCSVASKYVSACSCAYGLQPTTITAATPSTTVYVSATVTSVSTSLETVATLSMTTTAATETVTTTDKTVTVLPTATTYTAVFALQIVGGVADGQYLGNNGDFWYAPRASRDSAATFTYNPATGYVVDTAFQGRDGGYLSAYASGSLLNHGNVFDGDVALVCSIDAAAILSCSNTGPSNANTFLLDSFPNHYPYQPLQDGQIRVLDFNAAQGGAPLSGVLRTIALDDETETYQSLPYVWGAPFSGPDLPPVINLGSGVLPIFPNLDKALRAIRLPTGTISVWIDAVCINQQDLEERVQQVTYMAKVYSKASTVRALQDMLGRAYFTRVWVVQEAALGRSVQMQVGSLSVTWSEGQATRLFLARIKLAEISPSWKGPLRDIDFRPLTELLEQSLSYTSKKRGRVEPPSLLDIVHSMRHRNATDPRDKIYAMMGLALPEAVAGFVPDYSESWQDTYERFYRLVEGQILADPGATLDDMRDGNQALGVERPLLEG